MPKEKRTTAIARSERDRIVVFEGQDCPFVRAVISRMFQRSGKVVS